MAISRMGQGTWGMGEDPSQRDAEAAALRHGLDLGLTLIDTAEMYGEGGAEEVVARALEGRRGEAFIVTKFYPHHADRAGVAAACERSLQRLRVERIDLYLLHWRGSVPLEETLEALRRLTSQGKIGGWGVSNFDVDDLADLAAAGGDDAATNQILYNLSRRGPEFALIPACRARRLAVMAYSPVEQGRLLRNKGLAGLARRLSATPAQVALAWALRDPDIIAIPKAASTFHVEENRAALDLALDAEALAALDAIFPSPERKTPLEML